NFADVQRGIVWELALALLPKHIRLLLLSATVGNSAEFMAWLERCHGRKLELVESKERKVPLTFRWVPDEFLGEQRGHMARGGGGGGNGEGGGGEADDGGGGLLLQPRRVLERRRDAQGAGPAGPGGEGAAQRRGGQAAVARGGRAQAQADAAPGRRRPPRGHAR